MSELAESIGSPLSSPTRGIFAPVSWSTCISLFDSCSCCTDGNGLLRLAAAAAAAAAAVAAAVALDADEDNDDEAVVDAANCDWAVEEEDCLT